MSSDEVSGRPPVEREKGSGEVALAPNPGNELLARVTWWLERVVFPALFLVLLIYYRPTLPSQGGSGPWIEYLLNMARLIVVPLLLLTARTADRARLTWRAVLGVVLALGAPFFFEASLGVGHWYDQGRRIGGHSIPNSLLVFFVSTIYSAMLVAAYLNLGRNLSVTPVLREVVSAGLYAYVRHPVYSAALHLAAVTVTVFASWNNVVCLLLLNGGAYLRMIEEEVIMSEAQPYRDYLAKVKYRVYTPLLASPLVFLVLVRLLP